MDIAADKVQRFRGGFVFKAHRLGYGRKDTAADALARRRCSVAGESASPYKRVTTPLI